MMVAFKPPDATQPVFRRFITGHAGMKCVGLWQGLRPLLRVLPWLALVASSASSAGGPPSIAAAADLHYALDEVVAAYQRESGVTARVTYGSSGNFFTQLQVSTPSPRGRRIPETCASTDCQTSDWLADSANELDYRLIRYRKDAMHDAIFGRQGRQRWGRACGRICASPARTDPPVSTD